MSVKWTDEQLDAIEARGSNILVAAAAGSGKTAVLVERLIRKIMNKENPVSIDKFLLLTFTEAAASEMRRKISDAIDKKLAENPDDEYLKEQSIKVGSASISTIHAFCSRILTNNAHLTNLPVGFSLIDETENEVLKEQALNEILESYYSRIDKKQDFKELVTGWGGIKGDDYLRETILKIHNFSRSLAYPKKWLRSAYKDTYKMLKNGGGIEETIWADFLKTELYSLCEEIADGVKIMADIAIEGMPLDHSCCNYFTGIKADFLPRFEKIEVNSNDAMDRLIELIHTFDIPRMPSKKGVEDVAERAIAIRDDVVKTAMKSASGLIRMFSQENILRTCKCSGPIRTLISIVRQTEKLHQRLKNERGVIDFNDLEHGLLRLLVDERGNETPLCERLRSYYSEILIDEFQDTNALQFEIFNRLSKKQGNLFMVGDVKQSIYKFRNADPSIFMRLYRAYGRDDGGRLIKLFKNFRSRSEVIDSANYIFASIMSERVGGINYTEDEYLIKGAEYPDSFDKNTELLITATEHIDYEPIDELSRNELEANAVANRISKLIYEEKIQVTDKETGELRAARLSDIAVLTRNKAEGDEIELALSVRGIPSVSESGIQYLNSVEVKTVLSFLQIIDNPLQDIPLIAVMRSPIFGFTLEELAKIRTLKKGRFYDAVKSAEDTKTQDFVRALEELRKCSKYMGVDELVYKICNEYHYVSIVSGMQNGEVRKANLKLLQERASDYEKGVLSGLFNFMKYIDMLQEKNKDLSGARIAPGDAVSVMTIHRSKGLEFPIVILAGTIKKFNFRDIQQAIIWDDSLGIAADYIDTRQRVRFNLPSKQLMARKKEKELKAEEMRLLYVAITRAKEKLIISVAVQSRDNRWKTADFDKSYRLYPALTDGMNSMRDWILASLLNHPDSQLLKELADRHDIISNPDAIGRFDIAMSDCVIREAQKQEEKTDTLSMPIERLKYEYPYSDLSRLPIKLSVSELKRRRMPEGEVTVGLIEPTPDFAEDVSEITAAERGTITHFVIQHIDIRNSDIKEQIEEMIQKGVITKKQAESVDADAIYKFFESDLGQRLKKAEHFEREFDFYMQVDADEVEDVKIGEKVLLQGIADCFFYEDDGIVLIDYKTDRVTKQSAKERSERYVLQAEYYARGLEMILKKPVKEKYLYFLNCNTAIKM